MKHKFYYLLVVAIFMVSCSTDETELFNSMDTAISENISRSIISEPIDSDSVSPLIMTDEMRTLNEAFNYKRRNIKTVSYSTDDPYVSMNLFAIREIPIKIAVKQVSLSGSKASRKSFKTKSAGHDIFLESHLDIPEFWYYIKALPSHTGIPYLIYSCKSRTPLTMGTLNNTKVVMSQNDSITLTDFAGWDIIPSGVNPGFFTILNQRYIGQDGSSDFGSLYRYAIEASTNNTLRFAKPEEGKAQQEFQILPVDSNVKFVLDSIEYNISSARIISKGIIEKDGYGENLAYESKSVDVEFNFEVKEESRFEEKYGNIFPLIVEYGSYQRPYILGDNVRKPKSNTPKDAPYKNFPTSVIRKRIIYKEGLILDARTLVDLRLRFHYCNVAVDYIARSRYVGNDKIEREMIFTGTWHGLLYQDPTVVKPEVVSKKISILPGGSTGGDMELRVKNDKLY